MKFKIKEFMKADISKSYIVLVSLICLVLIGSYFSYAMFTVSKERNNAISIVTGNLTYKLEVDGVEGNKLTVPSGETKEFTVTLSNPNNRTARFNFYYVGSLASGVEAGYVKRENINVPPEEKGINLEKNGASNSSNTYTIKITNTSSSSATITLGVSVGLDYNELALPSNGHLFEEYEIELYNTILNDSENRIDKSDSEQYFVTASDPNNYVWYSGKLWRVVSVNPSDNTVKAVTNETIAAMGSWGNSSNFSGSYIQSWLNNTDYDGFLGSLKDPENFIDMNSKWNATTTTNATSKPAKTTMVTNAVGLINAYEYSKDISWALINEYYFLLNPNNSSSVWKNGNEGVDGVGVFKQIGTLGVRNGCMIRPAINFLSSVKVLDGDGTLDNPYRLKNDNDININDSLNQRESGEWVLFDNKKFRIVSVESNGITKIVSANSIMNRAFATNSNANFSTTDTASIGYYLNNTYYNSISSPYKEMIVDGPWYLGSFTYYSSWRLEKCTNESCTSPATSVTAKIGLLRHTELMSGHTGDKSESYWSLTPSTYIANSVKVNGIYGSNWEETANRTTSANDSSQLMIRPALYLSSNVKITGGLGTKESPFQLAV